MKSSFSFILIFFFVSRQNSIHSSTATPQWSYGHWSYFLQSVRQTDCPSDLEITNGNCGIEHQSHLSLCEEPLTRRRDPLNVVLIPTCMQQKYSPIFLCFPSEIRNRLPRSTDMLQVGAFTNELGSSIVHSFCNISMVISVVGLPATVYVSVVFMR